MDLISTVNVGAGNSASDIDFMSIPQGYTDLMVVYSLRSAAASRFINTFVRFNGDASSTNYSYRRLIGSGSATSSDSGSALTYALAGIHCGANATANTFGNSLLIIPNYTASTTKTFSVNSVQEDNQTEAYDQLIAGAWVNNSAITRITIGDFGGNALAQYSTASLYGVLKGSGGATVS